jgi:hypothetical protein
VDQSGDHIWRSYVNQELGPAVMNHQVDIGLMHGQTPALVSCDPKLTLARVKERKKFLEIITSKPTLSIQLQDSNQT